MNHFPQILQDPNILRTTSSCTDNYSGDSFDMYNFQISLLGGQGGPLTYCQFTFWKNKAIITEPNLPPTCQWLFHQLLCASSRLMTRIARPRVRFTWSISEFGGKNVFFVFMEKIFEKHGNVSTLPNKKRENIQAILNEFWGSNLFQIWSKNDIIPGSTADLQCRWLEKFWERN